MPDYGLEIYEWATKGACTSGDPDALFVQGAAQHRAKVVCMGCSVRTECLAEALDSKVEFGVWGGMTERERRSILRRRPDVTSWRSLLLSARDEHVAQKVIDLRDSSRSTHES
jgi:WhiB family redox-sensing transcriptional regulator